MSWNGGDAAGDGGWKADDGFTADSGFNGAAGDTWGGGGDTGGFGGCFGDAGGDADDKTCRHCHQPGHFARECPDKPEGGFTGECYNCGETGHNKADCTNARVERPFTGKCNVCGEEGHAARACPTKGPMICRNCKQEGHRAAECTTRRAVDWTGIPELSDDEAWKLLLKSAAVKDLDTFRLALKAYARAIDTNFKLQEIERTLREDKLPVYLIAKETEVAKNMTIVDPIGNIDCKYVLSIQLSDKPRRARMAQGWPENPEQNLERLANAGFIQDRGIPVCSRCDELGHIAKHCKEEAGEPPVSVQPEISCVYCSEIGHRARDCPKPRVDPYACKRCGKSGHKVAECTEPQDFSNVECRKCNEMGHMSKECPNEVCRNCTERGHHSRDCNQPKNPANTTCRNCEKIGHFSKDCPEPKDWSKVKCSNCGEMGHTMKRCKQPIGDSGAGGDGGFGNENDAPTTGGGWSAEPVAASGGW